jgi:protein SCO1/2
MNGAKLARGGAALAVVLAVAGGLLAAIIGCTRRQLPGRMTNVSGLVAPLEFHLTDQNGVPVSAASYRGHAVLLYFGYTHCTDECPTTLATLADALQRLGPQADLARVLFVTVDPRRDTEPVLRRYVSDFGPQFVGLRGTTAQLTRMIKRYRVTYSYQKPYPHGDYQVDHSSAVFIFGPDGRARLLAQNGAPARIIAADLRHLLPARPAGAHEPGGSPAGT